VSAAIPRRDEFSRAARSYLQMPRDVVISGPLAPAELAELCECVRCRLEGCDAEVLVCDVRALTHPDVATVGALARLQLTARRLGRRIQLRDPPLELRRLLELCGLADVLPAGARLRLEPLGQPEEWEQPRGVEERVDGGDPPV
jgi:ABC-type transporter Mla MlaB component